MVETALTQTSANGAIYLRMTQILKDLGAIGKDNFNEQQRFAFRGIDQFINTLHPLLAKYAVFISPRVVESKQELREVVRSNGKQGIDKHVALLVEYRFTAADGSGVTVGPIASEGIDSGDKATNKALSAALKYALIQTFCVPTEDMVDGDSESPQIGAVPGKDAPLAGRNQDSAEPAPKSTPKTKVTTKETTSTETTNVKDVLTLAQLAVSKKIVTREQILATLGAEEDSTVTKAVNAASAAQLGELATSLKEKLNA